MVITVGTVGLLLTGQSTPAMRPTAARVAALPAPWLEIGQRSAARRAKRPLLGALLVGTEIAVARYLGAFGTLPTHGSRVWPDAPVTSR
jgi:hypothetical protein